MLAQHRKRGKTHQQTLSLTSKGKYTLKTEVEIRMPQNQI